MLRKRPLQKNKQKKTPLMRDTTVTEESAAACIPASFAYFSSTSSIFLTILDTCTIWLFLVHVHVR